jgi:hypothetical protein
VGDLHRHIQHGDLVIGNLTARARLPSGVKHMRHRFAHGDGVDSTFYPVMRRPDTELWPVGDQRGYPRG